MEKQQAKGRGKSVVPSDSGYSNQSTQYEEHAELDILDSLNLAETSTQVKLKELLLDTGEDAEVTLSQLGNVLQKRMLEGNGETLFDIGQEDNGESMGLSKEQWDVALDRTQRAASVNQAECRVLMTRNVGGDVEAETPNEKDKSCTGKIMIRQAPETPEDVIETRIAVVGNGTTQYPIKEKLRADNDFKWMLAKVRCLASWSKEVSMTDVAKREWIYSGTSTKSKVAALALWVWRSWATTQKETLLPRTCQAENSHGKRLENARYGPSYLSQLRNTNPKKAKVISFTDLAGHERYLRTTVFGLLSSSPNYCLLMVAANNGLIGMSK